VKASALVLPLVVGVWIAALVGVVGQASVRSSRQSFETSLQILRAQSTVVRLQQRLARSSSGEPGPPQPAPPTTPAADRFSRLDAAAGGRP